MRRRDLLAVLGGAGSLAIKARAGDVNQAMGGRAPWPFANSGELGHLQKMEAVGFKSLVSACVYDGARLESGMPLGGLGTGYLRLDGDGRLGLCSIFNKLAPPEKLFYDWLQIVC